MRFPREWFGPREELVPFGPRARAESDGPHQEPVSAERLTPPTESPDGETQGSLMALDFWGGMTTVDELIPFPECSTAPGPDLDRKRRSTRSAVAGRLRLGATAAAVVCLALIAGQVVLPNTNTRATGGPLKLAQADGRIGTHSSHADEPRIVSALRLRTTRAKAHATLHRAPSRQTTKPRASRPSPSPPPSTSSSVSRGQPVVYSDPSASSGSARSTSATSGGAGGDFEPTAHTASKPGPTGLGASFGPGHMGK